MKWYEYVIIGALGFSTGWYVGGLIIENRVALKSLLWLVTH